MSVLWIVISTFLRVNTVSQTSNICEKGEERGRERAGKWGTAFSSFEESGAQAKPTDSSTEAARQRQIERHRERRDRGVAETGLNVETDPKGFDSVPSSLLPL